MNTSPRPHYTEDEKHNFYASAAKRFKAELKLYGGTAVIHLENKNDELFWGKVLNEAYPQGKFRFISASRSISGNITSGCTQCLQYRAFLDQKFWIAIDSDYRYLSEEQDIDAKHYILQTYTYSFENHFCYWENCQRAAEAIDYTNSSSNSNISATSSAEIPTPTPPNYNWKRFLENYSRVVYPLLVWQMYLQGVNPEAFPKSVFHRLLSLPIGPRSAENDGEPLLQVLKDRCHKFLTHLKRTYPDADNTWFEARCNAQGVRRDNSYLFVRGHQLYDMIVLQGRKLNRHFERELTKEICFGKYEEITKIHNDIITILTKANIIKEPVK